MESEGVLYCLKNVGLDVAWIYEAELRENTEKVKS